ncbi:MAG: sulfotransferase family protein [Verrucomicrobiae bacterium]|nr:sulfotransferase family protein [Verrucomicrobiae bacterium]
MTKRLCLWSGPRNVSTALMYSFAQRSDTRVVDEPLYAHFLVNHPARGYHPGAELCIQSQDNDGERVVQNVFLAETDSPVVFFKSMAHHLIELDWDFLKQMINVLLIRDPRDMLHSYSKTIEAFNLEDTGYPQLKEIYDYLDEAGIPPMVVDSKTLLQNPETSLRAMCSFAGIPFETAMLSWQSGPKPFEGAWAPYWYHNVHGSTGFIPYHSKTEPFPENLQPLLDSCHPFYAYLKEREEPGF